MSGPDAEALHDRQWDCQDKGCGECRCCRYLAHLEFASNIGGDFPRSVERDLDVEAYLDRRYPHWRS